MVRMLFSGLAVVLGLFLVSSATAFADGFEGRVYEETGPRQSGFGPDDYPLANVEVLLTNLENPALDRATFTDEDGRYAFFDLNPGMEPAGEWVISLPTLALVPPNPLAPPFSPTSYWTSSIILITESGEVTPTPVPSLPNPGTRRPKSPPQIPEAGPIVPPPGLDFPLERQPGEDPSAGNYITTGSDLVCFVWVDGGGLCNETYSALDDLPAPAGQDLVWMSTDGQSWTSVQTTVAQGFTDANLAVQQANEGAGFTQVNARFADALGDPANSASPEEIVFFLAVGPSLDQLGDLLTLTATREEAADPYPDLWSVVANPSDNGARLWAGCQTGTFGGQVFEDTNGNGSIDGGDAVLQSVPVFLFRADETEPMAQSITDASGMYLFDGLELGTYAVEVRIGDPARSQRSGQSLVAGDDVTSDLLVPPAESQPPVARAGGPYLGFVDEALSLDGSASTDPEGSTLSYAWDFGDGTFGAGEQPSHTWTSAGIFTVVLTVTDGDGLTDEQSTTATISEKVLPVADAGGPYSGTIGLALTLDGSGSTGNEPLTYAWDFGDGTSGSGVRPSHTWTTAGTFMVTLTLTDVDGNTDEQTTTLLTVPPPEDPVANPGGPYFGQVGMALTLDGSGSTGSDPLTYDWDFGDGTTGTGVRPSHAWSAATTYEVTLTVTDVNGLTDSWKTEARITRPAPVANPGGPYGGVAGTALTLSGSASTGVAPFSYAWDFGDGTFGAGQNPSHTWSSAGTFPVLLTVRDALGLTDTKSTTATILVGNRSPVANPGGPYAGLAGQVLTLDGSASTDPEGSPLSYAWDFGDGSFGAGERPSHAWSIVGAYTVKLTVTDAGGLTSTASTLTRISHIDTFPPVANPGGPYSGSVGEALTLDGSGSTDPEGSLLSYAWDFGDGTSGAGERPSHTWADVGVFEVSLTVTDAQGWTNTSTTTATIAAPPPGEVDLDIQLFWATKTAQLPTNDLVTFRALIENNGRVDEPRMATLVGMHLGVEFYRETLPVRAPVGPGREPTSLEFAPYRATHVGDLLWVLEIADDDPDADRAFAVTEVEAGCRPAPCPEKSCKSAKKDKSAKKAKSAKKDKSAKKAKSAKKDKSAKKAKSAKKDKSAKGAKKGKK